MGCSFTHFQLILLILAHFYLFYRRVLLITLLISKMTLTGKMSRNEIVAHSDAVDALATFVLHFLTDVAHFQSVLTFVLTFLTFVTFVLYVVTNETNFLTFVNDAYFLSVTTTVVFLLSFFDIRLDSRWFL